MKKTYLLTSKNLKGVIRVSYENGIFKGIETELKETLKHNQFVELISHIPFLEEDVSFFNKLSLEVALEFATNEKIALFCRLYEERVKVKYKVSASDSGKMKGIKVDETLLRHYFFTSTNFIFLNKYSIGNLVKYYNELKAEMASAAQGSYPSHYSKEYEKTLPPAEVSGYWAHLRGLGLKPKKNRVGVTIDWV